MKSFGKWAGIIALTAAIFALVSCDHVNNFFKSEYPEFPQNLRGTWEKGTDSRRIDANTFSITGSGIPALILAKVTGNNYSLRTPSGSTPSKTMTKTLVIDNSNLVISGCNEESCGENCNGTWTKKR